MKTYSYDNLPRVNPPASSNYYYFEGALDYTPVKLDSIKEIVIRKLTEFQTSSTDDLEKIKERLGELEVQFGEKFIKVNDKPLGFVDVEAFLTLSSNIQNLSDDNLEKAEKFFALCEEGNSKIIAWLEELEKNARDYDEACREYNKARGDYLIALNEDQYGENKVDTSWLKNIMMSALKRKERYNKLPGVPNSPDYGYWITKRGE